MAKIYYKDRAYYSIEEKVNIDDVVSEIKYNWFTNQDKTLIVRQTIATGEFRWYFNNFDCNASQYPPNNPVPSNLQRFIKNQVMTYCKITPNLQQPDTEGYVGFWDGYIRLWNLNTTQYVNGHAYNGIMESTDTGKVSHPWEEPTFDPING